MLTKSKLALKAHSPAALGATKCLLPQSALTKVHLVPAEKQTASLGGRDRLLLRFHPKRSLLTLRPLAVTAENLPDTLVTLTTVVATAVVPCGLTTLLLVASLCLVSLKEDQSGTWSPSATERVGCDFLKTPIAPQGVTVMSV